MRQWMVAAKKADFYAIAEKFHVDPVVARIIRNREVIGEKNIRIYLGGNLSDLSDPHQMKDMDRLVEILAQKIRKQVHIRIIGDYDVDGVTSSTVSGQFSLIFLRNFSTFSSGRDNPAAIGCPPNFVNSSAHPHIFSYME